MSRTTSVGSPTTFPMTRLSPAGTAAAQFTSEAEEAVGVAVALGLEVVEPDGDADGEPVVCAMGVDPPHAASVITATRTPVRRSTA